MRLFKKHRLHALTLVFILSMCITGCGDIVYGAIPSQETASDASPTAPQSGSAIAGGGAVNEVGSGAGGDVGTTVNGGGASDSGVATADDSYGAPYRSGAAPAGNTNNDIDIDSNSTGLAANLTVAATADAVGLESLFDNSILNVDIEWSADDATMIAFDGTGVKTAGSGAVYAGKTLTINQAGTYVLTGTQSDGQILIDAGKKDLVRLVLNGVSLHNETGPAIYAPKAEKVELILEKSTKNAISDGPNYIFTDNNGEGPNAAIYVQNDLAIAGGGSLTVTGKYKHGIRAQDILAISGGELNATATGDALRGRDGVVVSDGAILLEAGGDGIQSNNDSGSDTGFVYITGGVFTIRAKNDGIQAESALAITGGKFDIVTGGGSSNAPAHVEDFRGGGRGGWGGGGAAWNGASTDAEDGDSVSMRALKAGAALYIAGGEFTIDAEDDGVHSKTDVNISAGKLTIKSSDDAIHADAAVDISGGVIDIPVCYEGVEGMSVTIGGGYVKVIASDDAINAADGTANTPAAGGQTGRGWFAANEELFVRISGGVVDLYAPHDGIDSNGNVFLEGGSISISGPSQGVEGAIDLDGTLLVNGGELITAGSVANVSQESAQPVILVSYASQQTSGSVITIKDARADTLLEYKSQINYSVSGFTSPSFNIGETYTLYIDGVKKTDIKLNGAVTSVSDNGGAYSGGRGGFRGNWNGGARAAPA